MPSRLRGVQQEAMDETMREERAPGQAKGGRRAEPKAPQEQVTWEMIAERAYHISLSPEAGSDLDNWLKAEEELLGRFLVKPTRKARAKKTPSASS